MNYRRLGRTNLQVSVVGFGTCQFRLIPERQALQTLHRGFELGVNLIHTAPDYEGADDLVARAIRETSRPVIVCSQGYGPMDHFERLFESACAKFGKGRLDLFGIACVDDREAAGENVWGTGGMVEFLRRKKAEGRLGGIFCTTHGTPAYLRRLIESDAFDALMVAYNPLGFHLLSYYPPTGREFENLPGTREQVFPLAQARDIGLMIMKPLAGGLLCTGKAFPPRAQLAPEAPRLRAGEVLRSILQNPEVACVVPGTASPAEAEENALAGHGRLPLPEQQTERIGASVRALDSALCSRCGGCESSCSRQLPVSWLFRAGYISLHPSETFETPTEFEYFRLHPDAEASCSTCTDVTCGCPQGVNIPGSLTQIHGLMGRLKDQGLVPPPPLQNGPPINRGQPARVVIRDVPAVLDAGAVGVCRLFLENTGAQPWHARPTERGRPTALAVSLAGTTRQVVRLRQDVHPGERTHFVFELTAPSTAGQHALRLDLVEDDGKSVPLSPFPLVHMNLTVQTSPAALPVHGGAAVPAYGVDYLHHNLPQRLPARSLQVLWLTLVNRGTRTWRRDAPDGHSVDLVFYLDGVLHGSAPLPRAEVRPGERVTLHWFLRTPEAPGRHQLKLDLVEQNVTFFEQQGVAPLVIALETTAEPPTASSRLMDRAFETNSWFFSPSQGVFRDGAGQSYPLFARKAKGCRITDVEGRQYIDYVMGWGCALLGYAHDRVQRAVGRALESGAVITLTHELEMEVTQTLCETIPCAEMVLFGKNGSDVCTAAVRLARVHTGRSKILVCGYHGWQDWYVEKSGFASTGVPGGREALVLPFPFNDLEALAGLLHAHRGEVAAVMLEPAGPVEGLNGPLRDADPAFLKQAAELTRQAGALLIFDEIITGFRYPGGSVQKATGVVPDLACFGKALSNGMPLSALVGRREVFRSAIGRIYYGPTFKGEVYSFAAAKEALAVYQKHDVPGHVWQYGGRLQQGVNQLCRTLGAPAELIGPPFRMVLAYRETNEERLTLMRTLMQQELVKHGVITYKGFMLPSFAHDDKVLALTLKAFEQALGKLVAAVNGDAFARYLEIPPVA